jgi:anthranilate phosphoribosyltransferase
MKKILKRLFEHKTLERSEAKEVMVSLAHGAYNDTEISAFITVFLMRSITIDELQGFRDGLLELALPVELDGLSSIDIVGTGGDGKNTFNISTLACFIVAGAGVRVAKHGNYGATSVSGASNVMEQLGYRFKNSSDHLRRELEEARFCYLHAPIFHPALKAVAQIRKNIGFRTFFNMLGPLVNPARPDYQLVGVYNLEMARIYTYLLQQSGKPFTIIHSLDGYDEVSLTSDTKMITQAGEKIFSAEEIGRRLVVPQDIHGGQTVEDAARIFMKILKGEGSWAQNAVVLANAAVALHGAGASATYDEAYSLAVESLESGTALRQFQQLIALQ